LLRCELGHLLGWDLLLDELLLLLGYLLRVLAHRRMLLLLLLAWLCLLRLELVRVLLRLALVHRQLSLGICLVRSLVGHLGVLGLRLPCIQILLGHVGDWVPLLPGRHHLALLLPPRAHHLPLRRWPLD
jgi:hypothetical protein